MILALIEAARPRQWVKNGFLLAPLVFSRNLFHPTPALHAAAAFALFSAAASAVYLGNDLLDVEGDRAHPVKRKRPIASGRLSPRAAAFAALALSALSIGGGLVLQPGFAAVVALYLVINLAYSTVLKKLAYVDVVIIASGFVLRVLAGAQAIEVPTSHWIFVCTFFLALFLGFGKRRHELLAAEEAGSTAGETRKALTRYDAGTVGRLLWLSGAAAVASFLLYSLDPETQARFGTWLAFTTIFPAFGVLRFRQLVERKDRPSSPTEAILTDGPFVVNVLCFLAATVVIVYRHLQS